MKGSYWRFRWGIGAVLLLCVVFAVTLNKFRARDPLEVWVAVANYQDVSNSVSSNGKIVLLQEFQARAMSPGTIGKIYVHVGEKVQPGQMLIALRDPFAASRMASARSGLQGAETVDRNTHAGGTQEERYIFSGEMAHARMAESDAEKRLATLKQLYARGSASEMEVAAAEHAVADTTLSLQTLLDRTSKRFSAQEVENAHSRVGEAQANLETAREVLANANITSSIAGTVYSIPVSTYDFVNPGADLVRVADLNRVEVRAFFDEPEIGQLKPGQKVDITWEAKPGKVWHGHVTQVPLTVFPFGTRIVGEGRIELEDSNGELLPNIDVRVNVKVASQQHVLTIPREALRTEGPDHFVYRVVRGRLERARVSVGLVNLQIAQITGGILPSDQVVLASADNHDLEDGEAVKIVEARR